MEGVIGYVTLFAGNFAPRTWAFCQGQLLSIASNTALFSILGTTYGGNGQTTFALPDLRSRAVIGQGQGPGLSQYSLGEVGGTQVTTLISNQVGIHQHPMTVTIAPHAASSATQASPIGGVYATTSDGSFLYHSGDALQGMANSNGTMTSTPNTTGNVPFSNQDPLLGLNYLICMQGVFPARN